jgi:hypothetical protein
MTPALTSKTGNYERNWKKICFLVCMCGVGVGLLLVPLRSGQETVHFLAGVVLGLALGGIWVEFSKGPKQ